MADLTKSPTLRDQFALYQRQAESWKASHEQTASLFNLETVIALGVAVFSNLSRLTHWFNELGEQQGRGFDRAGADEIRQLYAQWTRISDPLFTAAEAFRMDGYDVAKADEFSEALHDARTVANDFDRIISALEQFSRGRGRPLGEAMDEIRRRTVR
jgi:hypothetical protein